MSGAIEQCAPTGLGRFKPYPAYKDSGVGWLGEIPAHWKVKRLKHLFGVVNGSTPKSEEPDYWDGDIPWVTPDDLGELASRELASPRRYITEAGYRSCGTTIVPAGSLVLSTRAPIGHLAIAGVNLCTNQGCRSLVFRNSSDKYYFYYQLLASRSELESWGQGSTFRELAKTKLESVPFVEPLLEEQRTIAAFLDRETARIDALVAKTERLIELLQENRTALITRAVTKGLPSAGSGQATPSVPMKDSGVEWLGEIPAHWEARAVWTLFALGRGHVISHEEIHENPGPYPVYSSQTEDDGVMGYLGNFDFDGDFLTWTTDGAHAGTVFSRRGKFNCTNVCGTLRAKQPGTVDLQFMRDALNVATVWFVRHDINPKLMNNVMARIRVQMPPYEEQHAIAAFLDRETAKIDVLIAKVRDAIDRLKELRTALISTAVTGKIDVRGDVA